MNKRICGLLFISVSVLLASPAYADKQVVSKKVGTGPVVDGNSNDAAWKQATEVITHDPVANIDISIRSVHTQNNIFMLVRFPDDTHNTEHKTLEWEKSSNLYRVGHKREDTLVFKWNMEAFPVDISLSSDTPYRADIWYWKSFRTDHAGFADDKYQTYGNIATPKAQRTLSKNGKTFYLTRKGDSGRGAYKNHIPLKYQGDEVNGYELRTPEKSRADVRAKGQWKDGYWTVEFSRKLNTGNSDDIELNTKFEYRFGLSRYEIAGRQKNPKTENPLFGSGEISEHLTLTFEK